MKEKQEWRKVQKGGKTKKVDATVAEPSGGINIGWDRENKP